MMERKLTNDDDKFYRELDEKKSHKSCCTCQTFVILFIILFLILGGITFFIYWQITHGGVFAKKPNISLTKISQDKLTNIKPNKSGNIKIVLTSDDLTNLISEGYSSEKVILKDTYVSINKNNIVIYGTLVRPLSSKVSLEVTPKVEDKKISFLINKVTAGKMSIPLFLVPQISNSFSEMLNMKFNSLYEKYEITQINLNENKMEIIGKLK